MSHRNVADAFGADGVTEPIEFTFLLLAPALFVAHAC